MSVDVCLYVHYESQGLTGAIPMVAFIVTHYSVLQEVCFAGLDRDCLAPGTATQASELARSCQTIQRLQESRKD